MLVMILERKHILTSVLHRDKVDIFTESTRKKNLKPMPLKFLSESFLHCNRQLIL